MQAIGLARCPFDITNFEVKDGRKANITNSGFGTVFAVVDGAGHPVCDYAGFAPFGEITRNNSMTNSSSGVKGAPPAASKFPLMVF